MIILTTQLEVAHDDGDFGTGQDQDDEDDEQESKDVIELVTPNGRQDEEELDEYGTKGQDTSHQNREQGAHVPHLFGDLTWDLIRANGVFRDGFLVSEVASKED